MLRYWFKCLSVGLLLALAVNMLVIFYMALLSGDNQVLVTINDFSEAKIEAVLFPLILISGIFTLIMLIKEGKV